VKTFLLRANSRAYEIETIECLRESINCSPTANDPNIQQITFIDSPASLRMHKILWNQVSIRSDENHQQQIGKAKLDEKRFERNPAFDSLKLYSLITTCTETAHCWKYITYINLLVELKVRD